MDHSTSEARLQGCVVYEHGYRKCVQGGVLEGAGSSLSIRILALLVVQFHPLSPSGYHVDKEHSDFNKLEKEDL